MLIQLLLFTLFLIVYLIVERFKFFRLFAHLGIPGPPPNFFVGNMLELMGPGKLITDVMTEWEEKYGLVYGMFRGLRATLVVREPELMKQVLIKNSQDFINRPMMVISVPPLPHTLVGLRSSRWKEVRQALSPAFSGAKIKQMLPIMESCVKTTVEILNEKAQDSGITDAHKLFQGLACDVISACALAMKVNSQRDPQDKFLEAVKGFLENAMGPFVKIALCFPLLAKVMGWGLETFGYSHEMTKMIMESVRTSMKLRRGGRSANGESLPLDALQLMIDATVREGQGPRGQALSDEEIVANAWVFVLGGFETTSSALSYTCYLLSLHPEVQDKLFDELEEALGTDGTLSYDLISGLSYLDQVICESLRLYPPVVTFVIRGMESDTQIGPYLIPKHVGISIPVWQVHHDPKIWPEPYKFEPHRFANNAKKTYANNMEWIPFGTGPRSCIGARFALLNLKFTLCSILRNFKIIPTPQTRHKLKLRVPSVTILPVGGIPLKFVPREA